MAKSCDEGLIAKLKMTREQSAKFPNKADSQPRGFEALGIVRSTRSMNAEMDFVIAKIKKRDAERT